MPLQAYEISLDGDRLVERLDRLVQLTALLPRGAEERPAYAPRTLPSSSTMTRSASWSTSTRSWLT